MRFSPGNKSTLTAQPTTLSLNVDGRTLAQAMSTALSEFHMFPGQAPSADGMGQHFAGDHGFTSA